ncbi:4-oxalomesaconate tautomerase [Solimonas marina]|uniref:4-oxalomesaconate tautomerase n=1 Tax=Solimonas marina TaxID=2714601 RepID=A0A970B7X7_9GAMM|nr:4-oxalomesaconate tautomerase [Solimonas marina]NKF24140.1 4-oxalomesaconate tautomerase [Solimonas marina]
MNEAPCMWMRGGTSKGGYFLADDLPSDRAARDAFLLGAMGSPDRRQIDGMGGADPLTSKVAIVRRSQRPGIDVDYLFLQVFVDRPIVSDAQNCGNILAGVAPFAIERGLVAASDPQTTVRVYLENSRQTAMIRVQTPGGRVRYGGDAHIDGVPGTASPVDVMFRDTAGSSCGALLPTGRPVDHIDGIDVTCIDNGMPLVIMKAADFGLSGQETREALDANVALKARIEAIRLQAGQLMQLGDVSDKSVPKMTLVSPATQGGHLSTRSFIPHRCHASIGVFAAVTAATAAALDDTVAASPATLPSGKRKEMLIEHPSGATRVLVEIGAAPDDIESGIVLTARKLFDGVVYAPETAEGGR